MKNAVFVLFLSALPLMASDFHAGIARAKITPPTPFWMSGYAARTNPAPVVLQDIWAKALYLKDDQGHRVALITMDLIGLPQDIAGTVYQKAAKQYKLKTSELLLNCSHTHSGPVVGENLGVLFNFNEQDAAQVRQYAVDLTETLVRLIGDAIQNESPAVLSTGSGSVNFAINRRLLKGTNYQIGVNTNGPVDHSVPVLRIGTPEGKLRALLFGYACHNTTLGGDSYRINGDYAGHAQAQLELDHPGVTAMFLMLCGSDQNPNPRGTVELVRAHGKSLADEVDRVLATDLKPVRPPIRTAYDTIQLDFAPHTRQMFEQELQNPDKYRQRRARLMLSDYDQHKPVQKISYPVQALRFNADMAILALGGEVVMDYCLRAKQEYARENLIVSSYCNNVMCYIPSKRILNEGGYEPVTSMIYYGMPGPFTDSVEEKIFTSIHKTLKRVGASPSGTNSVSSAP